MDAQLALIDSSNATKPRRSRPRIVKPQTDWRLDQRTRDTGRRGIAEARARLAAVASSSAA